MSHHGPTDYSLESRWYTPNGLHPYLHTSILGSSGNRTYTCSQKFHILDLKSAKCFVFAIHQFVYFSITCTSDSPSNRSTAQPHSTYLASLAAELCRIISRHQLTDHQLSLSIRSGWSLPSLAYTCCGWTPRRTFQHCKLISRVIKSLKRLNIEWKYFMFEIILRKMYLVVFYCRIFLCKRFFIRPVVR